MMSELMFRSQASTCPIIILLS